MNLIKTSILSAIAVGIKMLTLLGLNKILAIYVGPSGYAVIGQFQNVMSTVLTFSSGAINTGVTKYTAEHFDDENLQQRVWQTAVRISLICSILVSIILIIFHQQLALFFLKDIAYGGIFLWFSVTLVLFVFNALLLAILNGKKEIKLYVAANIAGSLVGLIVTGYLAFKYGLYGALLALVTNQSVVLIFTFWVCRKQTWFIWSNFLGKMDPIISRNLGKYVLMSLTSAVVVPLTNLMIRNHLIEKFGWESAGYWDAISKISSIYLMFVTTTLGVYYLPRLSEIRERKELRKEIFNGYKVILPIVIGSASTIYYLRSFIIELLFTTDFLPMQKLFIWQMAGDVLKISSWLFSYVMLGKAMTRLFISTQIIFCINYYVLCLFFTNNLGLIGVSVAYLTNYIIYFVIIVVSLIKLKVI